MSVELCLQVDMLADMIPRRHIINGSCYTHVIFRCHNREFLFEPEAIKTKLLKLWAKYSGKYAVRIVEFVIMDNHAHMLVDTRNAECLGRFMRTVNSQIARYVNSYFERDSQVIRERYKSPIITNNQYFVKTQQYVWLNRFRVSSLRPEYDKFCSASWRLNPSLYKRFGKTAEELQQLATLLKSYRHIPRPPNVPFSRYIQGLINAAIGKASSLTRTTFENSHTVGDDLDISFRAELLNAFRRQHLPTAGPPLSGFG